MPMLSELTISDSSFKSCLPQNCPSAVGLIFSCSGTLSPPYLKVIFKSPVSCAERSELINITTHENAAIKKSDGMVVFKTKISLGRKAPLKGLQTNRLAGGSEAQCPAFDGGSEGGKAIEADDPGSPAQTRCLDYRHWRDVVHLLELAKSP